MSEMMIEVRPAQLDQIAATVANRADLAGFTQAARATHVESSVWGDQAELARAAEHWQERFAQAATTLTDGLTTTKNLLAAAADEYRVHDACTAEQVHRLTRSLDHGSPTGPRRP